MPDDNSKSEPPLPIPNRTVKRLRADDSAATSVKVGHRQAFIRKPPESLRGFFFVYKFASRERSRPIRTSDPAQIFDPPGYINTHLQYFS